MVVKESWNLNLSHSSHKILSSFYPIAQVLLQVLQYIYFRAKSKSKSMSNVSSSGRKKDFVLSKEH